MDDDEFYSDMSKNIFDNLVKSINDAFISRAGSDIDLDKMAEVIGMSLVMVYRSFSSSSDNELTQEQITFIMNKLCETTISGMRYCMTDESPNGMDDDIDFSSDDGSPHTVH